jgi:hypothetical protein
MVTQATAETTTGKKRGRPAKTALPTLRIEAATKGERGTDFQRLIKAHSKDTIVKGFAALRFKLYKEGEPVDEMTRSIKKRIADLQAKGGQLH